MIINEETIRAACNYLAETLIKKNHDYGNSVEEQYKEYGDTSLHLRIEDKLRRVKNLANKDALVPEDEAETYLDAAGYSILASILKRSEYVEQLQVGMAKPSYLDPTPEYFDADDQH